MTTASSPRAERPPCTDDLRPLSLSNCFCVGEGGLEPPRPEGHWHLKPARLPFRHSPETTEGPYHCSGRAPQPSPRLSALPHARPGSRPLLQNGPELQGCDSQNSDGAAASRCPDTM